MKNQAIYCLYDTSTRAGECVFCGTMKELEKYTGRNSASLYSAMSHGHTLQNRYELVRVKV